MKYVTALELKELVSRGNGKTTAIINESVKRLLCNKNYTFAIVSLNEQNKMHIHKTISNFINGCSLISRNTMNVIETTDRTKLYFFTKQDITSPYALSGLMFDDFIFDDITFDAVGVLKAVIVRLK